MGSSTIGAMRRPEFGHVVIIDVSDALESRFYDLETPLSQGDVDEAVQRIMDRAPEIKGEDGYPLVLIGRGRKTWSPRSSSGPRPTGVFLEEERRRRDLVVEHVITYASPVMWGIDQTFMEEELFKLKTFLIKELGARNVIFCNDCQFCQFRGKSIVGKFSQVLDVNMEGALKIFMEEQERMPTQEELDLRLRLMLEHGGQLSSSRSNLDIISVVPKFEGSSQDLNLRHMLVISFNYDGYEESHLFSRWRKFKGGLEDSLGEGNVRLLTDDSRGSWRRAGELSGGKDGLDSGFGVQLDWEKLT